MQTRVTSRFIENVVHSAMRRMEVLCYPHSRVTLVVCLNDASATDRLSVARRWIGIMISFGHGCLLLQANIGQRHRRMCRGHHQDSHTSRIVDAQVQLA